MAAILHMQNALNKHALYYKVIKVKRKSSFIWKIYYGDVRQGTQKYNFTKGWNFMGFFNYES